MTMNNQENGGITSIFDNTSSQNVGKGVERKNSKDGKTVFVVFFVDLLVGGCFMIVLNIVEQIKQQVELKEDEAIKAQTNNMPSIADAMAEIQRQEAEKEEARLKAEEEDRRRREQAKDDRLEPLQVQQQEEPTIVYHPTDAPQENQ